MIDKANRPNFRRHALILVLAALLPTACIGPRSTSDPVYYYTLEEAAEPPHFQRRLPQVVRVERFTANPPFNSQHIVYADKGLHRNTYAHFRWIAPPGELFSFFLTRYLQQSEAFKAVLPPDASTPPTHHVHGWIETFLEEDYKDPAQASLSVNISLIDGHNPDPVQRLIFQKRYHTKAPCNDKTPAALSEAMSKAAASLSAQIAKDIHEYLSKVN
ncbi:MAG: hypothetical protein HKP58_17805 [Desulfatitalea sp.]|nr:membrane integrity-associated transporter subunit PqiC [Desulfatitalea sp.]NNK02271.1 hypothetical protein [Desulfatitalea sp.]